MLTPSEIKEILKDNNLKIRKDLGQNFLIDKNLRDKIVKACGLSKEDIVIEIGPGLGVLTDEMLSRCKHLIAVERDRGLCKLMETRYTGNKGVELINADILDIDISEFYCKFKRRLKVIGNLPFYITSPIIFHLFNHKHAIDSISITVQREVAMRMVAKPKKKDYGILSCSVQYHSHPMIQLQLPRGVFFPMPDVDASFVKLQMLSEPSVKVEDEDLLFKIIKSGFNQRRKLLFNALSKSPFMRMDKDLLRDIFEKLGIDNNMRAENMTLHEYAKITDLLSELRVSRE